MVTADRIDDVVREHVLRILEECRGSRALAAQRLGLTPRGLYMKLQRYQAQGVAVPPAKGRPA